MRKVSARGAGVVLPAGSTRRRSIGVVGTVIALLATVGAAEFIAGADETAPGTTFTGEVSVLMMMTDDGQTHEHGVQLTTPDGATIALVPSPVTDELAAHHAGETVEVRGEASVAPSEFGDETQTALTVEEFTSIAAAAPPAVKERRAAVIRLKFADGDYRVTEQQLRDGAFDGPDSINAYWQSQSNGRVGLKGDVFSDVLPADSYHSCRTGYWWLEARDHHPGYQHYLIFVPAGACDDEGWAGLSPAPGKVSWYTYFSPRVLWHEMGHNLGFYHARSMACTTNGKPVQMGNRCDSKEYGDPMDPMGSGWCSYSAPNKATAGWSLPTATATKSTTVQLRAADLAPDEGTPQVLKLPRVDDAHGTHYYVEWHAGRLNAACSDANDNGLQIRGAYPNTGYTHLFDAKPETETMYDAPLAVLATFTDPIANLQIRLDAMNTDAGVATVTVTFGSVPPPPTTSTTVSPGTTTSTTVQPPGTTTSTTVSPGTTTSTTVQPPTAPAVEVVDGQLRVVDRDGAVNDFRVSDVSTGIEVTDVRALTVGAGCTSVLPTKVSCSAPVDKVVVDAGGGNDQITTATARKTVVNGGADDDTLHAGATADGPTRFAGGDGIDTADYSARTTDLKVLFDGTGNDGAAQEKDNMGRDVENVTGGTGNDKLVGSVAPNRLDGGKGNDMLRGGGGNDDLLGSDGDDDLAGGVGVDSFNGAAGNDVLRGKDRTGESLSCGAGTGDEVHADRTMDTLIGCENVRYR